MSYRVTFVTSMFNGPKDQALSHQYLQIMLDALFACNIAYLRANPDTPSIYAKDAVTKKPRMRYQQEPMGQEDWKDIPTCLRDGEGDCEDLACWLAAEKVVKEGIAARPFFTHKVMSNGASLYHIKVKYPDGTEEDPSKKLGMGKLF